MSPMSCAVDVTTAPVRETAAAGPVAARADHPSARRQRARSWRRAGPDRQGLYFAVSRGLDARAASAAVDAARVAGRDRIVRDGLLRVDVRAGVRGPLAVRGRAALRTAPRATPGRPGSAPPGWGSRFASTTAIQPSSSPSASSVSERSTRRTLRQQRQLVLGREHLPHKRAQSRRCSRPPSRRCGPPQHHSRGDALGDRARCPQLGLGVSEDDEGQPRDVPRQRRRLRGIAVQLALPTAGCGA